ncbi:MULTISPECIES: DUF6065 family protein [unclassified Sinorhizobium]|uniref:DUF6065 family protein n=1 Tax=Sinorhizobium sp. 6-117 TaxID=3049090 RepID=UPI0024C3F2C2|nr:MULTISPECIES: DUF6065 family protein [unclassified Sinorhizobium]MDK1373610.1 DUF6065 family protein [Sinorhizobium sp. 6-70]MDK1482306.1 DUF6065 family protein [Sinorhizobium sp. 6-117]
MKRGALETVTPTLLPLAEAPEIEREYRLWSESRNNFNRDLANPDSSAAQARWQKSYFRGEFPSGESGPDDHRSRLRLRPFK